MGASFISVTVVGLLMALLAILSNIYLSLNEAQLAHGSLVMKPLLTMSLMLYGCLLIWRLCGLCARHLCGWDCSLKVCQLYDEPVILVLIKILYYIIMSYVVIGNICYFSKKIEKVIYHWELKKKKKSESFILKSKFKLSIYIVSIVYF